MADVAAVAERLATQILPASTRGRVLALFGESGDQGLASLLFAVALHDLGKATPPFQAKWQPAVPKLVDAGFDVQPPPSARNHGTLGVQLIRAALSNRGVSSLFAHRIARAVSAHHGAFPTDRASGEERLGREAGRTPAWANARKSIVDTLASLFSVEADLVPLKSRLKDWAGISALAGLTSVADWVGSMATCSTT